MTRAGLLLASVLAIGLLTGAPALSDQAAPVSRAGATAALLAAADSAAAGTDKAARKALGQSLAALDRVGAHAQDGQEDALPGWRAQAGPKATGAVYRGRVLGPAYRRGWLEPGAELKVEQLFLGGQAATVAVAATPSQPLRLSIQGASVAAPCAAETRDCRWVPIFTERYTIRVRNAGAAKARYYLVFD